MLADVSGRGRWLKQSVDGRRRLFGDVALHAEPGESLEVRLHHSWPTEVDAEEAEALDTGLLRGLIHALLRPPYHVDGCLIVGRRLQSQEPRCNALEVALGLLHEERTKLVL